MGGIEQADLDGGKTPPGSTGPDHCGWRVPQIEEERTTGGLRCIALRGGLPGMEVQRCRDLSQSDVGREKNKIKVSQGFLTMVSWGLCIALRGLPGMEVQQCQDLRQSNVGREKKNNKGKSGFLTMGS
ncbi:hypothetical protein NDU88_001528 [Pleurodeles waltl]|uniref:Uncharacterized protein n=1 Tax=Pleurodeles waltl TaxID=8319 RepID=A0AAV7KPS7_PLEWA|nr:hypothetical protein NDU88_001528 [Pleurodeles waltl]